MIWWWATPYLELTGSPIILLPLLLSPGLYRKEISWGKLGTLGISLISSRFRIQPPPPMASTNSFSLVLLELNMMFFGGVPMRRAKNISGAEEQSKPKSYFLNILIMSGLGLALTAKNSWKLIPLPEKAAINRSQVSMIPFSS